MEEEQLSKPMQQVLLGLGAASSTIEDDIRDALTDAETELDFLNAALDCLNNLKRECNEWCERLRTRRAKRNQGREASALRREGAA